MVAWESDVSQRSARRSWARLGPKRFGDFRRGRNDFDLYRVRGGRFELAWGDRRVESPRLMRMIGGPYRRPFPAGLELTILGRDPVRDGSAIRGRIGSVVPRRTPSTSKLTVPGEPARLRPVTSAGRAGGSSGSGPTRCSICVQLSDRARDKGRPLAVRLA